MGEPIKNLRERGADSFHAALGAVLWTGILAAIEADDHPRVVVLINRAFAEGTPELGCDLLRQAMQAVGSTRTWTVQMAPRASAPRPRAHAGLATAAVTG